MCPEVIICKAFRRKEKPSFCSHSPLRRDGLRGCRAWGLAGHLWAMLADLQLSLAALTLPRVQAPCSAALAVCPFPLTSSQVSAPACCPPGCQHSPQGLHSRARGALQE